MRKLLANEELVLVRSGNVTAIKSYIEEYPLTVAAEVALIKLQNVKLLNFYIEKRNFCLSDTALAALLEFGQVNTLCVVLLKSVFMLHQKMDGLCATKSKKH